MRSAFLSHIWKYVEPREMKWDELTIIGLPGVSVLVLRLSTAELAQKV